MNVPESRRSRHQPGPSLTFAALWALATVRLRCSSGDAGEVHERLAQLERSAGAEQLVPTSWVVRRAEPESDDIPGDAPAVEVEMNPADDDLDSG